MSGRGRGRGGGGGGRGQQSQSQSGGRGGSGGGGGGGGRGGRGGRRGGSAAGGSGRGGSGDNVPPSSAFPALNPTGRGGGPSGFTAPVGSQPQSSSSYDFPALTPAASVSTLTRDVERKLTVQAPVPVVSQPGPSGAAPVAQQAPLLPVQQQPALSTPIPSSSKALHTPMRPGFGKLGRKCIVKANHFLVDVADKDLHHYDVSITPEVTSKKICRLIVQQLEERHRNTALGNRRLAYDGRKSAYAAGSLPFTSKDFVVNLVEDVGARERQFKVTIKFAAKANLYHLQQFLQGRQHDSPHETIQVLDVVLRASPSKDYEVVGRSFFHPDLGAPGELGDGLKYWHGFYQSLRPTQMGLSLNIDMSARAFYDAVPVVEFIAKYFNVRDLDRPFSDQDRVKVRKALKGVKVELNHQDHPRRYKISSLSTQPLSQLSFKDETGATVSVAQYFRRKYNIVLKYDYLPAIQSGNETKPVYLPIELCKIVKGQRYTRKLNEKQVSNLLKATCQRPDVRESTIHTMVEINNYNEDLVANDFGIHVDYDLTSVEARVLVPPTLMYHETGAESRVNPMVGQWNMINKKMIQGGKVDHWTCVSFSRNLDPIRFCKELIDMCCSKGMVFNRQPLCEIRSLPPGQIEKALLDVHKDSVAKLASLGGERRLQLLIIVLPDSSGSYGKIKRICETELGIVSQCCQPRQASRLSKQYLENVALKINVKVGGRNTVLEQAVNRNIPFLTDRVTIVFGADVTHPQPGEDSSSSIAAVVASMDWPHVTKYRGLVSAQAHREEIIQDLYKKYEDPKRGLVHGGMIRDLFIAFRASTGLKPTRIIFYRDGVSEGQFNQVLLYEMDAIRKACNSLEENYLPPVTFIVVQKRHHTRLFSANHHDKRSVDRSGNILPGTVVDTKICHPTEFDFYLCSHAGIQGTSRPTHYHVLYDENNFSADGLQTLTNNLCYTYARCTRSVSIVPPAYYAHLAAFRARYYIEGEASESGSTGGGKASRDKIAAEVRPLPQIKENVKNVMFYC